MPACLTLLGLLFCYSGPRCGERSDQDSCTAVVIMHLCPMIHALLKLVCIWHRPAAEKAAPAPTASLLGAPASTDLAELYRARAYARYANFLTPQTSAKPTTAPSPAADPEPKEDDKDAGKDATPSEEAAVSMKAVQSPPKRQRTATRRLQRPANAPPASGESCLLLRLQKCRGQECTDEMYRV